MTFSLNNKSTPHKHIPPTADAILVSLNWLGPGHIFRSSYNAKSDAHAKQHIITLDTKSSMATYIAPDHPFPSFDRNHQSAYVLCLPRWDEDASGDGNKSLVVVGDVSSVDLEVLGNIGNIWHRQSQENPLTLPLDKAMDDTILLALDIDLIDTATGTPVMYAYLNDGTLQGWQVKHTKPYIGMVSAQGLASTFSQSSVQSQESGPKDYDMSGLSSTTETPFTQSSGSGALFGQQTSSSFGQQQSSTFGQSPFGQQPSQNVSVFGQSPFGQLTSSTPSAFSQPTFGKPSLGTTPTTSASGFAAFANTPSFGSPPAPGVFGSPETRVASGFNAFASGSTTFGSALDASMSVDDKKDSGGAFSSFVSNTPTTFASAAIVSKPSGGGFGAFAAANPSPFGATPVASTTPEITPKASAFAGGFASFASNSPTTFGTALKVSESPARTSVFGTGIQSSAESPFASPTLKSAFSDLTLTRNTTNTPGGSPKSALAASAPSSPELGVQNSSSLFANDRPSTPPAQSSNAFSNIQVSPSAFKPAAGFGAFGSAVTSTASPFFKKPDDKPISAFGTLLQGTTSTTPASTPTFGSPSALGGPKSVFAPASLTAPSSPELGVQNSSSLFANDTPTPPAPRSNAFSNIQVSPSAFKPAAGFGAFGSAVTSPASPFFKKPDDKPPISAFGSLLQGTTSTTPASTPTFGSPSALGGPKSVFAPASSPSPTVKPTTSDGFGAFSGSMGGFSAFAGPKKSFSELLKTGDPDPVKPSTPLAFSTPSSKDVPEEKTTPKAATPNSGSPSDSSSKKEEDSKDDKQKTPKSVFSALSASVGDVDVDGTSNTAGPDEDKKQSSGTISDEPSYGIISGSSAASSFVDVKDDQESDGDVEEDADDGEDDGVNAFLSEDASSDGSYEDQESAEESSATEDSEAKDSPPLEPAAIPLPISRSPSATPQPEIPTIEVSPSPPSEERSYRSSSLSPARDSSTTPPGTPTKVPKPLFDSSPSTGNVPIPSPSGIGLGRPSTRPARSSPLANAVLLSGHDEDDEDREKTSQPPAVAPKSVFNTLPVKVEIELSEGQSPTDKRPKTPPLSSTMGGTSFFASKSSTAPVENLKFNAPTLFSFQKPPAMASPSVFGNSSQVPVSGPSLLQPTSAVQRPASAPTPSHPTFFGMPPPVSSPNASVFNIPPVNPQTSTISIPLTSAPQGLARPSPFPPIPKSTSGPSPPMGSPSFFAPPSQPAPSSQLKAPPAASFASSPAFSAPQKSLAETAGQVALEEGMQKECIYSVSLADKELEEVSLSKNFRCALHLT